MRDGDMNENNDPLLTNANQVLVYFINETLKR